MYHVQFFNNFRTFPTMSVHAKRNDSLFEKQTNEKAKINAIMRVLWQSSWRWHKQRNVTENKKTISRMHDDRTLCLLKVKFTCVWIEDQAKSKSVLLWVCHLAPDRPKYRHLLSISFLLLFCFARPPRRWLFFAIFQTIVVIVRLENETVLSGHKRTWSITKYGKHKPTTKKQHVSKTLQLNCKSKMGKKKTNEKWKIAGE